MKFAVLSDIHSNVFALEAVIADAKIHSVELMINLGDILYGPIAPKVIPAPPEDANFRKTE